MLAMHLGSKRIAVKEQIFAIISSIVEPKEDALQNTLACASQDTPQNLIAQNLMFFQDSTLPTLIAKNAVIMELAGLTLFLIHTANVIQIMKVQSVISATLDMGIQIAPDVMKEHAN